MKTIPLRIKQQEHKYNKGDIVKIFDLYICEIVRVNRDYYLVKYIQSKEYDCIIGNTVLHSIYYIDGYGKYLTKDDYYMECL